MVDAARLLKDLQRLLVELEGDLRERVRELPELDAQLREQHRAAVTAGRSGDAYEVWRDEFLTQVAVAWVLGCVFVRFLEDNHLVEPPCLAGPGERGRRALDEHELYFRHPDRRTHSDRDYLLDVFEQVRLLPAAAELFDPKHNPLWAVGLSGDGATRLLQFWRRVDPDSGALAFDFSDPSPSPPGRGAGGEGVSSTSAIAHPSPPGRGVGGEGSRPSDFAPPRPSPPGRGVGGEGNPSTIPGWNTRFLGDLYQDLSEGARKRYALLQTPEFVEAFILDRTLTPAIEEFGLQEVRLLDPTCGSGHFLLGAFERLFERWVAQEPETNPRALAQRALDQVYGVDLNPYAVAIARFRLLIAALKASGVRSLRREEAPAFHVHVAAGDSLLHGRRFGELDLGSGADQLAGRPGIGHAFFAEDLEALERILGQRYHAVVGNPPYITVKDRALNQLYRDRYKTCHRQYSLGVPFTERFFELAMPGVDSPHPRPLSRWERGGMGAPLPAGEGRNGSPSPTGRGVGVRGMSPTPAGFVGMITANSFMKREFGSKLIEEFLPTVDLTHVIDTSGAYVPGHGTPTVILFGRHRRPLAESVRTVMGIKGEPTTPDDPSRGLVWSAIVEQVDRAGSESEWVSVADTPRASFAKHPWSIGGGGAADLKEEIEAQGKDSLGEVVGEIGFVCMTRADDVYFTPRDALSRAGIAPEFITDNVEGDRVRDWAVAEPSTTLFPYDAELEPLPYERAPAVHRFLWPYRTILWLRREPNGNHRELGLTWWEWSRFQRERFRTPLSIAFAFVATHNHFILDRGGKVFNRSAPVIKLPAGATEDDHLALLGLLNSSTACFWMKQVFHSKGGQGINEGIKTEKWEQFNEFTGTGLEKFPLAADKPLDLARTLDRLAQDRQKHLPAQLASALPLSRADLDAHRAEAARLLRQMIALQEELDWRCYRLYGVTREDLSYHPSPAGRGDGGEGYPPPALPTPSPSPSGRGVGGEGNRHGVLPSDLLANARELRKGQTDAEGLLWLLLRDRRLGGFKFRRQHPVPPYVLDFYCHEKRLAVELDGGQHVEQAARDGCRTRDLERHGIRVLRFWNNEVLGETERVLEAIWLALMEGESPQPRPSPGEALEGNSPHPRPSPGGRGEYAHPHPSPGGRGESGEIGLGERAFEIVLAQRVARGELQTTWFERHRSTPITEVPADWPEDYRRLVERRIALIESDRNVGLIERPEYKRRWNTEPWEEQEQRALRGWLLDRLEGLFRDHALPLERELQSTARLADRIAGDGAFLQVAEVYRGRPDFDVHALVAELVGSEAVPFLPALRYKETGLRNRAIWERTWELQRGEDAIDAEVEGGLSPSPLPLSRGERGVPSPLPLSRGKRGVPSPLPLSRGERGGEEAGALEAERRRRKQAEVGDIPVPPKYRSADFLNNTFWRLRGALDVPKERFVSYPHCSRDTDPSLLVGWAGWDHLQQAQALATYYLAMKEQEGWNADRLTPLLAGLLELIPWVKQWHNTPDPQHGVRMGDYFEDFVAEEARELRLTPDQIRAWSPPAQGRRRKGAFKGAATGLPDLV